MAKEIILYLDVFSRAAMFCFTVQSPIPVSIPVFLRVTLAVALTFALAPSVRLNASSSVDAVSTWIVSVACAVGVSLVGQLFASGGQMLSLQSGLSYASIQDPTSSADATAVEFWCGILGGWLFLGSGYAPLVIQIATLVLGPVSKSGDQIYFHLISVILKRSLVTGFCFALAPALVLLLIEVLAATLVRLQPQMATVVSSTPFKILGCLSTLSLSSTFAPGALASLLEIVSRELH